MENDLKKRYEKKYTAWNLCMEMQEVAVPDGDAEKVEISICEKWNDSSLFSLELMEYSNLCWFWLFVISKGWVRYL